MWPALCRQPKEPPAPRRTCATHGSACRSRTPGQAPWAAAWPGAPPAPWTPSAPVVGAAYAQQVSEQRAAAPLPRRPPAAASAGRTERAARSQALAAATSVLIPQRCSCRGGARDMRSNDQPVLTSSSGRFSNSPSLPMPDLTTRKWPTRADGRCSVLCRRGSTCRLHTSSELPRVANHSAR